MLPDLSFSGLRVVYSIAINILMNYRITRTKSGSKIHRSPGGSSVALCGVRAFDVRCTPAQFVASAGHVCGSCFSNMGVALGLAFVDAFKAVRS